MQQKSYHGARKSRTSNNYQTRQTRQSRPQQKRQTGSNIHPSKFVNRAVAREDVPYEPKHKFSDFALNIDIQRTLDYLGLTVPSAIQDQAIEPILEGNDVIGLANTGTGKTAAFLLPIIEKLSKNPVRNSVLILTPTRELAQQIDEEFKRFSAGQRMYSAVCVGGASIIKQIRDLQRNPHVIIATPGRLKDLIDRRVLVLSAVNTFVLDEADRMLDMGFVRDIQRVAEMLPNERQTLCFSATLTPAIQKIMSEMMQDPQVISVRSGETSSHIDQDVIEVFDKMHKISVLEDMLRTEGFEKVLVFCETKYGTQRLADNLSKNDIPAVAIHGNKTQSQREKALKAFKTNAVKVMIATDVAARGLDIPNVSHVINFDQPKAYDDYVHRIGRTGRAGKTGKALTFVAARQ